MKVRMMFVAACFAAFSMFAAAPQFTRDFPVAPYEYGDPARATAIDLATDGDGYLAAWSELRHGWMREGVYIARLSSGGTLLDQTGTRLGRGSAPQVVWTGSEYAVLWRTGDGIYGARVARDGSVIEAARLIDVAIANDLALATNGRTLALVADDGTVLLLDRDLTVRAQRRVVVTREGLDGISIAASADRYLIAVIDATGVVATQTLADDGALSAPLHSDDLAAARNVTVGSDGTSFLLLWTNSVNDLMAQVISTNNERVGAAQTLVALPTRPQNGRMVRSPRIAWSNGEYVVTYLLGALEPPHELNTLLVSRNGIATSEPASAGIALGAAAIAAKANGSGATVWLSESARIRAGLFDAASIGTRVPVHRVADVASAARRQSHPAIVAVDRTAVVAWTERAAGIEEVRLARAGGTPVLVASEPSTRVFVAYDGAAIVVAWQNRPANVVGVRRYTRSLQTLDPVPLHVELPEDSELESLAAANGVIVLGSHRDFGGSVLVTRIGATVESFVLSGINDAGSSVAVQWDGSRFAVAWRHHRFPAEMMEGINVAYLPLSGAPTAPVRVYDSASGIYSLRATMHAGTMILAWQEVSEHGDWTRTFIGRTDGDRLTPRLLLDDDEVLEPRLDAIAAHDDGTVDVYWWGIADVELQAYVDAMRLTSDLVPQAEAQEVARFFITHIPDRYYGHFDSDPDFAATVVGDSAVMAYERRDDDRRAGGIERVFVSAEQPLTPRRRRAVR